MATKLFFIYDPEDGNHLTKIEKQLKVFVDNGSIEYWHQGKLLAGTSWLSETETQLQAAQIVLPIVSADFLASDECNKWLQMAADLHKQIVPIIAGSCSWQYDPILKDKTPLPRKDNNTAATPLSKWTDAAEAYANVVTGIAALVKEQTSRNETNIPKQVKIQTNMQNNNMIIQEVTENTITLNINGELRKMPYTIAQLWADLQKAPSKAFQIGDKIYNIGSIDEADFGTILNNVKNAVTNSKITAGGNLHIGDIITNNYTNPNLSTTEPVILPNANGKQALQSFKQSLHTLIDQQGFDSVPEVLRKIENSDFGYSRSTLADLRSRATQRGVQDYPATFLTGLVAFIDSLYSR